MSTLRLDFETASDIDLPKRGLDVYSADSSTRLLMCAYAFDGAAPRLWEAHKAPFPADLREGLLDPNVRKWAFNSQFERVMTRRVAKIKTPIQGWRCTMVLAYMQAFTGGLREVGAAMGLPADNQKYLSGRRLVRRFTQPQKLTTNQPHVWRNWRTDPDLWEEFCQYCIQDLIAEEAVERRLSRYPIQDSEWELYGLDQIINDRGKPVNLRFVEQAIAMVARRKAELHADLISVTGLVNPNSTAQFLPWLQQRGYPFDDIRRETVEKVLGESRDRLTAKALAALAIREWSARSSVKKYDAIRDSLIPGSDRVRFMFQFCGAGRSGRWAGRRIQAQNLPQTPKSIEELDTLRGVTESIERGDYSALGFYVDEPMEALVGCVRSSFQAPEGYQFVVADLASIESAVIGWVSQCKRLLAVFNDGKDPYKDFATEFYRKPYDEVTRAERNVCKPPTLGCGYRLGGGDMKEGKKTGLWGYAEKMGVDITRQNAHRAVAMWRETYPEVPRIWFALERAAEATIRKEQPHKVGFLTFEWMRPYLTLRLPSGRRIFYYKPRIETKQFVGYNGETYSRNVLTYMGQGQFMHKWDRLENHGGRFVEQAVQGIARDVLAVGMRRAHAAGLNIVAHVHDEIVTLCRVNIDATDMDTLLDCMRAPVEWAPGLPLNASGWAGTFYRK